MMPCLCTHSQPSPPLPFPLSLRLLSVAMATTGGCQVMRMARCRVTAPGSWTPARAPRPGGLRLAAAARTAKRSYTRGAPMVRRRKEREMRREGVKKVDKEWDDSSEGGRREGIRRRTHTKTDGWIDGKKICLSLCLCPSESLSLLINKYRSPKNWPPPAPPHTHSCYDVFTQG